MRTTPLGNTASSQVSTSDTHGKAVADQVLSIIVSSLEESKAEGIVALDISKKSALADYMVVASGRSHRHVNAVADHLLRALKDAGLGTSRVEGLNAADWVLIDTGDVVIYVFRPEVREFYAIEKVWAEDDMTENDTLH